MHKKILVLLFLSLIFIANSETLTLKSKHQTQHKKITTTNHKKYNHSKYKKHVNSKQIQVKKLGYNTLQNYAVSEGLPASQRIPKIYLN